MNRTFRHWLLLSLTLLFATGCLPGKLDTNKGNNTADTNSMADTSTPANCTAPATLPSNACDGDDQAKIGNTSALDKAISDCYGLAKTYEKLTCCMRDGAKLSLNCATCMGDLLSCAASQVCVGDCSGGFSLSCKSCLGRTTVIAPRASRLAQDSNSTPSESLAPTPVGSGPRKQPITNSYRSAWACWRISARCSLRRW